VTISIPDRVVVFDYGEVISHSPSDQDRAALLAAAGIAPEDEPAFWGAYWQHRPPLDQGRLLVAEYWRTIARDLGHEWTASQLQAIWIADFRGWWSLEPAVVDLIAELHGGGTRVALLSNAGFDFVSGFRYSPMAEYFETVFVSAEMDAIKPDPAIYREVAGELGIDLDQMVFVDNKSENTEAAAELGVTVHHYAGAAGLDAFLRGLATPTAD
jgi:putative hydrolase of the HAD superfamily